MAKRVNAFRSFFRSQSAASPALSYTTADRGRSSANSIKAAAALLAFFSIAPLTTAADSADSAGSGTSKPTYSVTALPDTYAFAPGVTRGSQEKQGIAWLDDQRVMFVGFTPGHTGSKGLYVWDVAANAVSRYSDHTEFCFADGYITAIGLSKRRPDGTALTPIRHGPLGKEENLFCDSRTGEGCPGRLNMSCKRSKYMGKAPFGEYARYVFELRDGDGAIVDPVDRLAVLRQLRDKTLEEKRTIFSKPLLLVSERLPKGKPLPITALEEITVWNTTYSRYGGRYVFLTERPKDGIPGYTSIWPQKTAQPVYLMGRDGSVEQIDVPLGTGWSKIHLASMAVPGVVFQGGGGPRRSWGGLFLYDTQHVWQLDRGQMQTLAVSDNGCKVAYAIDNEFGKKPIPYFRLKLVRFC